MFAFSRVFISSRLFEKMRQRARFKITMRTSSIYSRKYLAKDDNRKSFFSGLIGTPKTNSSPILCSILLETR